MQLFALQILLPVTKCKGQELSDTDANTLYFLGDAGDIDEKAAKLFRSVLSQDISRKHVFFLGDNLYPAGLRDKNHPQHSSDYIKLDKQLELTKNTDSVQFVPGNHDWGGDEDVKQYSLRGLDRLRNQQNAIEEYYKNNDSFAPSNGCPGPVEKIIDSIGTLTLDTQWLLYSQEKKALGDSSCLTTNASVYSALKRKIENAAGSYILITHHPLRTYGAPFHIAGAKCPHGINCPAYRNMRDNILSALQSSSPLLCVAGHDHSLQVIDGGDGACRYYIVSGAMSNVRDVLSAPDLLYGKSMPGFVRVKFKKKRRPLLEVFTISTGPKKADFSIRLKID